jgi:thioredoxin 1
MMKKLVVPLPLLVAGLLLLAAVTPSLAAETSKPTAAEVRTVEQAYPGLASAALTHATLGELPKGVVLKAGDYTVAEEALQAEIAKAAEAMQEQLRRNTLFLLEQRATRELLLREAKQSAGKNVEDLTDNGLIQAMLEKLTVGVKVTDAEIASFYEKNRDAMGDAKLAAVKDALSEFLLQQKRQELVAQHVRAIGLRTPITVSATWLRTQAEAARNNPVDKARGSGKASLVDFGSQGCRPCDMLAPILEVLKKKYEGKANVLFVSVREQPILASRYGIQSIPVQIFFDKDGKEAFRHTGFWPQDELEKKLGELGVK